MADPEFGGVFDPIPKRSNHPLPAIPGLGKAIDGCDTLRRALKAVGWYGVMFAENAQPLITVGEHPGYPAFGRPPPMLEWEGAGPEATAYIDRARRALLAEHEPVLAGGDGAAEGGIVVGRNYDNVTGGEYAAQKELYRIAASQGIDIVETHGGEVSKRTGKKTDVACRKGNKVWINYEMKNTRAGRRRYMAALAHELFAHENPNERQTDVEHARAGIYAVNRLADMAYRLGDPEGVAAARVGMDDVGNFLKALKK